MTGSLRFLGLARKAGQLEIGEETVGKAVRAKKAKVILSAGDVSDNSRNRAGKYAEICQAPWVRLPFTKEEIGMAVGRGSSGIIAVTDIGFAVGLVQKLADEYPGQYEQELTQLKEKEERAFARKREMKSHRNNVRMGKRRTKNEHND